MIELKNISKSFEDILAVDRVNVTVKENTLFGLIGTNGTSPDRNKNPPCGTPHKSK